MSPFFFGAQNRANRGYSRTHFSLPLLLCVDASLLVLSFLPLQSNMELILCLFVGAKARGDGVCVFVCVRVPAEAATGVSKAALFCL